MVKGSRQLGIVTAHGKSTRYVTYLNYK